MRLLLDAHILLWWLSLSPRLPKSARTAISECREVYISAATAWEIAIKVIHALLAAKLPRRHSDPFDRMLVAQASFESLTLVTADPRLAEYGIQILEV